MVIDKTYQLPFPVDLVFSAWISPDTIISPITWSSIDPEPGGYVRLFMESPDHTTCIRGVFRVVERNERLIFSWECDGDGEVTEVDLMFSPAPGGMQLRILHTGFQKDLSAAMHDAGWDDYIDGFIDYLDARR